MESELFCGKDLFSDFYLTDNDIRKSGINNSPKNSEKVTSKEKEFILSQAKKGIKYKKIAEVLGKKVIAVNVYCLRHGIRRDKPHIFAR